MFSTGDGEHWMIMDRNEVMGWYANEYRTIKTSSKSQQPHKARQYRRKQNLEDPWLGLSDHPQDILYGEN